MSAYNAPVIPTQTTRSINIGWVGLPMNTANQILSANANREKVILNAPIVGGCNIYLDTSNTVSPTTSFLITPLPAGGLELDWPTDIWAYAEAANNHITFAESVLS
jgi:hypothetical protein